MNVLFVCSQGYIRSPTAAWLYSMTPGYRTRYFGTDVHTSDRPIRWADKIICMEELHAENLRSRFPEMLKDKPLAVLNLPDIYYFMDDDLIAAIEYAAEEHLGKPHKPEGFEESRTARYIDRYGRPTDGKS